ncbi:MAG: potassium-transporting ATPase subunit KdpA [Fimbriimonadaceae bacterium]|nr:potassium-transporting ATPase subunit KdpA [Fimbriimonadaceae bacterium]
MGSGALQIIIFLGLLTAVTKPLGVYMARVFAGEVRRLAGLERLLYRFMGTSPEEDQPWTRYALSLLAFSFVGFGLTYGLLRLQHLLPLNFASGGSQPGPDQMPAHLAYNTAASFLTNTNWQSYSPELALTTLSNMVALAIHNWMSAAVGLAVAIALIRGFARRGEGGIGNFWVDTTRATLYILLPIAFVAALVYVWQGVPQTFAAGVNATTLEGSSQRIGLGPVASQEAIKQLGTNGGGYFNANSAHPFENPTALSDLFTKLLIFLIPASLTATFGRMVGNARQGWAIFAAMSALFLAGAFATLAAEQNGNPHFARMGVEAANMEGKEARFGIGASSLFATITTAASCGAVNSMHGSYTPLGGLVTLLNMQTGEVIFGGVGAGLYGMLVYAILAVFIAGLMVGRTPEYLGKKIERFEVQMAMLTILLLAGSILGFTALASSLDLPKEGPTAGINSWPGSAYGASDTAYGPMSGNLSNGGPRGFGEMLYAFSSATGNNGSAFAGLTANTPIWNATLGIAMLIGRFLMIVPVLAIAGALARKKFVPATAGTFPTDGGTFVGLLVGTVLLLGALTFLPALALGPIVEQFQMHQGVLK